MESGETKFNFSCETRSLITLGCTACGESTKIVINGLSGGLVAAEGLARWVVKYQIEQEVTTTLNGKPLKLNGEPLKPINGWTSWAPANECSPTNCRVSPEQVAEFAGYLRSRNQVVVAQYTQ